MLLLAVLLLPVLALPVQAADVTGEQAALFGTDDLEDGLTGHAADLMADYDPMEQADFTQGAMEIFSDALRQSGSAVGTAAALMLRVLVILGLCQLLEAAGNEKAAPAVAMAGALALTAVCVSDLRAMVGLGQETMEELMNFSTLLLPVLAAAATATGALTGGGALYAVAALFTNLLIRVCRYVLIPLVYAFMGLAMADAALRQNRLQKLRELLGWLISTSLKTLMYLFTGFLAVTGILSGSADAAAVKAAQMTLSTMIPVVGGIISGAAETVLASAGLLKSAAGTFGMLAVLAVFLLPFCRMGISYLAFRTATALGGLLESKQGTVLEAAAGAMGYMLAMTGSSAVMVMLSCCCFLKVAQP